MICFFAIFLLFVCLHILSVRCGVLYATRKFNTELNKHRNKSYVSCDDTCFCWDVRNLISVLPDCWECSVEHPGYPEEEELEAVRHLTEKPFLEAANILIDLFEATGYGSGRIIPYVSPLDGEKRALLRLATGGWSGCEELYGEVDCMFRALYWKSSHRGGLHFFDGPIGESVAESMGINSNKEEA